LWRQHLLAHCDQSTYRGDKAGCSSHRIVTSNSTGHQRFAKILISQAGIASESDLKKKLSVTSEHDNGYLVSGLRLRME